VGGYKVWTGWFGVLGGTDIAADSQAIPFLPLAARILCPDPVPLYKEGSCQRPSGEAQDPGRRGRVAEAGLSGTISIQTACLDWQQPGSR
jgi:hypothetical protein